MNHSKRQLDALVGNILRGVRLTLDSACLCHGYSVAPGDFFRDEGGVTRRIGCPRHGRQEQVEAALTWGPLWELSRQAGYWAAMHPDEPPPAVGPDPAPPPTPAELTVELNLTLLPAAGVGDPHLTGSRVSHCPAWLEGWLEAAATGARVA